MTKKIILTGGGSAGHVTPNLALIEALKLENWDITYIGSENGIEKEMVQATGIPFYGIKTGKLRRYFSWQNFLDPFNVLIGMVQAYKLIKSISPDVVFSKGGFVALPVVFAAWLNRIPVVAHESDLSPGLANRLSFPFVKKICTTFAAAKDHFKDKTKIEVTGTPIRSCLFKGNKQKGLALCCFNDEKPILLFIGGSLGANVMNTLVIQLLDRLTSKYQVIHLAGKGKVNPELNKKVGYRAFEYVDAQMGDLFAASDVVISRSGANSLYEILALKKPHVLIPLSAKASRGDQIQNANYFQKMGISHVLDEDTINAEDLWQEIENVYEHRQEIIYKIEQLKIQSATDQVMSVVKESVC